MAILLLQGPLGPFFNQLASALLDNNESVYKINFNGGDSFFYSQEEAINFNGSIEGWPGFFLDFVEKKSITCVIAYGDCRFYHHAAKQVCSSFNIQYFAFEEGYLRPNYITFEKGGVNGHSPITHAAIEACPPVHNLVSEDVVPGSFFARMCFASIYYNVASFKRFKFPNYIHHRSFSPVYEALCWLRGFFRKAIYKITEDSAKKVCKKGKFFLVPLQVHNDAQIEFHSQYESIQDFIVDVLVSFSKSGSNKKLVFKHHPMDRGHVNYKNLIAMQAKKMGISAQVSYIHDQHLPTLLKSCEGVITINSTTALQAFYHKAPVFVMGYAFFDMQGLTYQGSLNLFWNNPVFAGSDFPDRFRSYILRHGQINGSFYATIDQTITNVISYLNKLGVIKP